MKKHLSLLFLLFGTVLISQDSVREVNGGEYKNVHISGLIYSGKHQNVIKIGRIYPGKPLPETIKAEYQIEYETIAGEIIVIDCVITPFLKKGMIADHEKADTFSAVLPEWVPGRAIRIVNKGSKQELGAQRLEPIPGFPKPEVVIRQMDKDHFTWEIKSVDANGPKGYHAAVSVDGGITWEDSIVSYSDSGQCYMEIFDSTNSDEKRNVGNSLMINRQAIKVKKLILEFEIPQRLQLFVIRKELPIE